MSGKGRDRAAEKPEMDLVAFDYRDIQGNKFTQVTANCKCGRGGWIRLPHHPKPLTRGKED